MHTPRCGAERMKEGFLDAGTHAPGLACLGWGTFQSSLFLLTQRRVTRILSSRQTSVSNTYCTYIRVYTREGTAEKRKGEMLGRPALKSEVPFSSSLHTN